MEVILMIHERENDYVLVSFGLGYPKCRLELKELQNLKFIGDSEDAFYEAVVSEKVYKRLTKEKTNDKR